MLKLNDQNNNEESPQWASSGPDHLLSERKHVWIVVGSRDGERHGGDESTASQVL